MLDIHSKRNWRNIGRMLIVTDDIATRSLLLVKRGIARGGDDGVPPTLQRTGSCYACATIVREPCVHSSAHTRRWRLAAAVLASIMRASIAVVALLGPCHDAISAERLSLGTQVQFAYVIRSDWHLAFVYGRIVGRLLCRSWPTTDRKVDRGGDHKAPN